MRKILNTMFANKKASLIIPIAMALLMYFLFLFFGAADDKTVLLIRAPIVSLAWFFGVFFVMLVQVKKPDCPERFLNLIELSVTVLFGIYTLIGAVFFVVGGCQNFHEGLCLGFVTYSAVSWAHNKRTKS